jgi:hypothetical protein
MGEDQVIFQDIVRPHGHQEGIGVQDRRRGIHQSELPETRILHRAGDGADIHLTLRPHQNDPDILNVLPLLIRSTYFCDHCFRCSSFFPLR